MFSLARQELARQRHEDFLKKHPPVQTERKYFFGLLRRRETMTYREMYHAGLITAAEADEIGQELQVLFLSGWSIGH